MLYCASQTLLDYHMLISVVRANIRNKKQMQSRVSPKERKKKLFYVNWAESP